MMEPKREDLVYASVSQGDNIDRNDFIDRVSVCVRLAIPRRILQDILV